MVVFRYDKTFEGLLTAIFDAYNRKVFPDCLLGIDDQDPLFVDETFKVYTDDAKSVRVWKGLKNRLQPITCNMFTYVWLSEMENVDALLFRFIRKVFDSTVAIDLNWVDEDVKKFHDIARKVNKERMRMIELVRFQKAADNVFFAPIAPDHNCMPLIIPHFRERFADQKWIIYDTKRNYGFYYDLKEITEMTLDNSGQFLDGKLSEDLMAADEKLFQELWRGYFNSMTIKERINPRLHKQHLPQRYWKYLTEKQL